jgi:hypothetical protein
MEGQERLPKFDYHLDESDPDVVVLRRQDGSSVAAFSAQGATRKGILEAAIEDYAKLVEAHLGLCGSERRRPKEKRLGRRGARPQRRSFERGRRRHPGT